MPDAVVIGAGPNGLVAANVLADHGWSVEVFEAAGEPGGAVRSAELIEPGFVNDVFSSFYPLAAASPVISALGLADHGLRWRHSPLALAHPAPDGSCPAISMDLDETAASLDALTPGDGDAWRALYGRWEKVGDAMLDLLMRPFPPLRAGVRLTTSMGTTDLARLARFALLPVRRMGDESFAGGAGKRLLAGNALHADFAPESTLSGFFGWLLCCLAQSVGYPVPEGGGGRLTEALVRRLRAKGGTVTCRARVDRVIVRGGRAVGVALADGTEVDARRAVVADVDAVVLFLRLVGAEHLPGPFLDDLRRFERDRAVVKVDWTLDGPIPWEAPGARRAGTVHLADSVDTLTLESAQIAAGVVPRHPFLLVGQHSVSDPTRQPASRETAWAYSHVPLRVRADAGEELTGTWDDADAERYAARVEVEIERHAPGFSRLIRGRHILTPPTLEQRNSNLVSGAINGGTAQLHQQLVFRPTPGNGRPTTPVGRLYLGSSSAHPGGGVHGACGSNAARAAVVGDLLGRLSGPVRRALSRLR